MSGGEKGSRHAPRWLRLALLALAVGCAEESTAPRPVSYVRVEVTSTGGDLDTNGYIVVLDGTTKRPINDRLAASIAVDSGSHVLELQNVATNCAVNGPNPRTVIVDGRVVVAQFQVVCAPTGFAVTVRTTGSDFSDAYQVVVDEKPPLGVLVNGSLNVSRLLPGPHVVTLLVPKHCTIAGGDRVVVDVVWQSITPVAFDVSCAPVVRLRRIAYTNRVIENSKTVAYVEVVSTDGSGTERLAQGDSPAWSPDGTSIVYSTTSCDVSWYDYYYGNCLGGLVVEDPEIGKRRALPAGNSYQPSWSPVGDVIAFEVRPFGKQGFIDADRSVDVLSLSATSPSPVNIVGPRTKEQPAWSPDGRRLAFVCTWTTNLGDSDLCIVSGDGTTLVHLTEDGADDADPAWSPDGTRIAFTRYPPGRVDEASAEVVVIDVDSSRLTTIGKGTEPAWSPDGSKLVLASTDGLFVVGSDGTNRIRLTTGAHHAPAWRP